MALTPVRLRRGHAVIGTSIAGICAWSIAVSTARAQDRVADTVHNLSAGGPGRIRAAGENQVCVFCHAPHNTRGVRPLWNRDLPLSNYTIYQSSTLDARPGQPTGASKLCLSCHDGTIALGSVLNRADRIRMTGGDFLPAGLTNLGTDLSDDHPVSFHFTSGLAASDRQLNDPSSLPEEIRLDHDGRLQCTSCHDPHRNAFGDFLVRSNEFGRLCQSCHRMTAWNQGSHATSNASVLAADAGYWPHATVAENACRSCHRPHTAGGHERLLIFEAEEENCLNCHDGRVARANIEAELEKPSAHDPRRYVNEHDPTETQRSGRWHVECADCHNPHSAATQSYQAGHVEIGATLAGMGGVSIGGAEIETAQHEYEVCFRCHADSAEFVSGGVVRQASTSNLRLKFSPTNPSYHPVVASSPDMDAVSLIPGLPAGSMIRCTDCHNNDAGPGAGGIGPQGPHGSVHDFLLERNYTVRDDAEESAYEYAMCYKCHERNSILGDRSFPLHRLHIQEERTPCSACHDPHGVSSTQGFGSDHTHLINFDTQIVRPDSQTGRLEFRDLGRLAGQCTLVCHGETHRDEGYDR
ncbi:MAG: hypothetical protein HOP29_15615 [Phycisphaerales bacterium]|nr:hypothetical protein [Phycisphaerales bacterium]